MPAVSLCIMAFAAGACGRDKNETSHEEASKLYVSICRLTSVYADSISNAPDSATVYGLVERFEERLDEVNYEVLPDTDYSLNEAENDTISIMLDSLGRVRARRLLKLANRKAAVDSVGDVAKADSIGRLIRK